MTGTIRLGLFGLLLAVTAGGAAAIGWAVGPLDRGRGEESAPHAPEPSGAGEAGGPLSTAAADGLSIAKDGLRVRPVETVLRVGSSQPFGFTVLAGERPLRDYDAAHERQMHLIVVSRDMSDFQHEHPTLDAAGVWRTLVRASGAGSYRAFADFSSAGKRTVLGWDLSAPGPYTVRPLPSPVRVVRTGPYDVTLTAAGIAHGQEATLTFGVARDGRPVSVDPYLGARGHLVILREGDLAYLHTHADEAALRFEATFPTAGRYRAFLQFSRNGSVHTGAFTLEVPE